MASFVEVFDDVTKLGRKIPTTDYAEYGAYPIIDQGQDDIAGYTDETEGLFEDVPAIIFGDHTRVIKYVDTPCFLGADGVKLLKAKIPDANYRYLYYVLQNARIPNTGYNRHFKWLKEVEIPLPDARTQSEIVAALDKVTALISLRKQQIAKLDELVKARFVEMFGDPVLNQRGFPMYTVDDVIEFQGGSQPDKTHFEYEPTPDNIRLIQIRDYKSDKYMTYIPKKLARRFCTADDIMIGRYGPPIFQILKGIEGSFNVALMKATPKMGNREYVRHFLMQDCLLEYLEGLSKRTAGQDGIQMDKLKAYPFPFPPLDLQDQFAAFVAQTDQQKSTIQQSLAQLELLKKALMQKYFG